MRFTELMRSSRWCVWGRDLKLPTGDGIWFEQLFGAGIELPFGGGSFSVFWGSWWMLKTKSTFGFLLIREANKDEAQWQWVQVHRRNLASQRGRRTVLNWDQVFWYWWFINGGHVKQEEENCLVSKALFMWNSIIFKKQIISHRRERWYPFKDKM